MLRRLVRYDDAALLGELAGPHARAVHDVLALEGLAGLDPHPGDGAVAHQDVLDADPLDDPHAEVLRAAGQRLGQVDRVHPAVAGDVEAGQQVVGRRPGEEVGHLLRPDLLDLEPEVALERRDSPVLVEPVGIGRRLDQPDGLEPGGHTGLRLEPGVEVAGVEPDAGAGLGGGAEAGHQPGRVPRRTAGEAVALEEHDVGPAFVREVVGDRAADHAATDDDDTGPVRQSGGRGHRHKVAGDRPPARRSVARAGKRGTHRRRARLGGRFAPRFPRRPAPTAVRRRQTGSRGPRRRPTLDDI